MDYIIDSDDSVVVRWLKLGADGWRLDVASEVNDGFWRAFRSAVKRENPEALLIGEVWEDASNKIAYDCRRRYFTDRQLDSVMNYPWQKAILRYVRGEDDGTGLGASIRTIAENYPPDVLQAVMNILSTHDTPRAINAILNPRDGDRTELARRHFTAEQLAEGKKRLKMAAFLQFMLPGMPCIYYGDEAGMTGYRDPFNRAYYPWGREDGNLISFYRSLARVKKASAALRRGTVLVLEAGGGRLMLLRQYEGKNVAVCCNRSENPWTLPHSGTILLGGGIAEYTGETLTLGCGGFCAMEGEEEDSDDPAALNNQGFWQKLLIFAAGALMNFLAGLIIIFCLYAPAQGFYQPVISGFAEGCPLESADGLQTGDRLVSIDGERVYIYSDVSLLLGLNKTGTFDLVVDRGGEKVRLDDFAMTRQTYTDQSGNAYSGYGIYFGAAAATFGDKLAYTWNNAVDFVRLVRLSLQMLFTGQAGLRDLSGPVGIVSTMVQVGEQSESTRAAVENIAYIAALIAVNLAVMNLLPLPALDGGRIFFLIINAAAMLLFRKQIPAKYENYIHFAGLILLLALMVVLVFSDVGKLIH